MRRRRRRVDPEASGVIGEFLRACEWGCDVVVGLLKEDATSIPTGGVQGSGGPESDLPARTESSDSFSD